MTFTKLSESEAELHQAPTPTFHLESWSSSDCEVVLLKIQPVGSGLEGREDVSDAQNAKSIFLSIQHVMGNWLIALEHVSVPVDLTTGKPDLYLKAIVRDGWLQSLESKFSN